MDILTAALQIAIEELETLATPELLEQLFANNTLEYYAEHGAHLEALALSHVLSEDHPLSSLLSQAGCQTQQERLNFFMPKFWMAMREKYA